mmetsp:Transcript_10655/g.26079  ORF Transcript_10655/g.26079 Transcript_10655/m.26079 type:complete len:218 (-) Transcript_10655:130-783(-)
MPSAFVVKGPPCCPSSRRISRGFCLSWTTTGGIASIRASSSCVIGWQSNEVAGMVVFLAYQIGSRRGPRFWLFAGVYQNACCRGWLKIFLSLSTVSNVGREDGIFALDVPATALLFDPLELVSFDCSRTSDNFALGRLLCSTVTTPLDLPPIVEKLGLRLQSVVTTPEELAVPNFEVSFDVSRVDRSSGDIILAPGFTFTAAPAATAPGCTGAAPAI